MSAEITYALEHGIAHITLNRPEVLNARNPAMRQALAETARQADSDPEVRVIILQGAGERAFCTGLDLRSAPPPASPVAARARIQSLSDVEAIAAIKKPVIAAIHGYALGGGLELALACDIRIASDDAKLGLLEVTRGLIPGSGGTQRLSRLVGVGRALELILTGKMLAAEQALAMGLVTQVVPKAELAAAALAIAQAIAAAGPVAVRYAKEAIRKGAELPLSAGLDLETSLSLLVMTSEDYAEGMRAFAEKRPPQFRGG